MPGTKRSKAVSQKQQQVAGIAHAIQKGEMKGKPGMPATEMAKGMSKVDTKSMASTKRTGLPVKKTNTGRLTKKNF